jgi:hypothetical protein
MPQRAQATKLQLPLSTKIERILSPAIKGSNSNRPLLFKMQLLPIPFSRINSLDSSLAPIKLNNIIRIKE